MRSAPKALATRRFGTLLLLLQLLPGLGGCEDLNEFRTGDSSVFHGEVVGSDSEAHETSFIRQGFESHTEMEITFDPELASGSAAIGRGQEGQETQGAQEDGPGDGGRAAESPVRAKVAGTIHTYQCPPETDFCDERDRVPGHFVRAELEPIGSLNHDALSEYDFPGAGRVRNYILGARFVSEREAVEVARHAMVFVSLMENGKLEVRVIAPSVLDADGGVAHAPLFGVFVLEKRSL